MNKVNKQTESSNSTKPVSANRLLKFRVWAENNEYPNGKMYLDNFLLNLNGDLIFPNRVNTFDYSMTFARISYNNINLMQFTGLVDKNGAEIYECDILKAFNSIIKIQFNGRGFEGVYLNKEEMKEIPIKNNNYLHWEIIGNVFENPELLTQATL